MSQFDPIEFGRMQGELEALRRDMQTLITEVTAMRNQMAEAKGGWKLLMMLGGAAATLGGMVATYLPSFMHGPKP